MSSFSSLAAMHLAQVRRQSPLVHNITNLVVMPVTANALLALGASPVMAHAAEEVEEITSLASALVLNIGTLSPAWVASMHLALERANARSLPVIIDPVGAGASAYRTRTARELLAASHRAVLRGNASEITALAGGRSATKGVDSTLDVLSARSAAAELARKHACTVCVSGAVDLIIDDQTCVLLTGGSELMTRVTGMGCTASAFCAAFAAVSGADCGRRDEGRTEAAAATDSGRMSEDETAATAGQATDGGRRQERLWSVVSAMAVMSAAGGLAARQAVGPGSFLPAFLDRVYTLTPDELDASVRIELAV